MGPEKVVFSKKLKPNLSRDCPFTGILCILGYIHNLCYEGSGQNSGQKYLSSGSKLPIKKKCLNKHVGTSYINCKTCHTNYTDIRWTCTSTF